MIVYAVKFEYTKTIPMADLVSKAGEVFKHRKNLHRSEPIGD